MIKKFSYEIWDEMTDFFEDFLEYILRIDDYRKHDLREINIHGHIDRVKPAYIFAERIDNFLKLVFGLSIIISGLTSTFFGFIKLSDLLEVLINSLWGRGLMVLIGASYLLLGIWKLINLDKHLKKSPQIKK